MKIISHSSKDYKDSRFSSSQGWGDSCDIRITIENSFNEWDVFMDIDELIFFKEFLEDTIIFYENTRPLPNDTV